MERNREQLEERTTVSLVKIAYAAVAGGSLIYSFSHMRGAPAMSAASEASVILIYAIMAMVVVFGVAVILFPFGASALSTATMQPRGRSSARLSEESPRQLVS